MPGRTPIFDALEQRFGLAFVLIASIAFFTFMCYCFFFEDIREALRLRRRSTSLRPSSSVTASDSHDDNVT